MKASFGSNESIPISWDICCVEGVDFVAFTPDGYQVVSPVFIEFGCVDEFGGKNTSNYTVFSSCAGCSEPVYGWCCNSVVFPVGEPKKQLSCGFGWNSLLLVKEEIHFVSADGEEFWYFNFCSPCGCPDIICKYAA